MRNTIVMPLSGDEQEWFKQGASIDFLHQQIKRLNQDDDNEDSDVDSQNFDEELPCWQSTFSTLLTYKKTLKQEHMLKYKLALTLLKTS